MKEVKYEIVITPKMSFGTGHHATTYMMIEMMKEIDFNGKTVLDFGTGTGILAILAEKSGAKKIVAIDNDDWSIENAEENFKKNDCKKIFLKKASDTSSEISYDLILANINKNVILENFDVLKEQLKNEGVLLVSGLLEADRNDILEKAKELNLSVKKSLIRNNWIAIQLSK
jgi:ribosomal protein L11 methyltransferase